MSLTAYGKVWEHSKQSATALVVLLAIADYARDDGTHAFSPNERMADKARVKVRGLQRVYEKLIADGELVVEWAAGPTSFTKGGPQKLNLLHVVYQDGTNAEAIDYIRARMRKGGKATEGDGRQDTPSTKGMAARTPPLAEGDGRQDTPHILNSITNTKPDFGVDKSTPQSPPARVDKAQPPQERNLPGMGSTRRKGPGKASRGHSGPAKATSVKGHAPIAETYFHQMHSLCFLTTTETEVLLTKAQRGQVAGVLGALASAGVDLGRLREFESWWASNWRSKERGSGQYVPPRPIQVQELWTTAMNDRDKLTKPARVEQDATATETLREAMLRRASNYGADKKER